MRSDRDLAGVREQPKLADLPEEERLAWQKLWSDVDQLEKQACASYVETRRQGNLSEAKLEQVHEAKMTAGKTYVVDMQSLQFDTYLRLEDDQGRKLAEHDDVSPDNLNSRIVFAPSTSGVFRIVATSYQQRGRGSYDLIIREFDRKKSDRTKTR